MGTEAIKGSRAMAEEDIIIERHSVNSLFDTLDEIKTQTKLTNGRVNELEKRSIGMWMADHQFRSLAIVVGAVCVLTSDIRNPVVEFLVAAFMK